jgi:regulator of cell morphogenesis and NO signaling
MLASEANQVTPDTNQTVREIAINNPATVRVFESLGIDYCCGGKRPLKEACDRANVPVVRALELLAAVQSEPVSPDEKRWMQASFHDLIDYIVTRHHQYVRDETPRLHALLAKVVSAHGAVHPELLSIRDLFAAMSEELSAHFIKEEQVLFPFLEKLNAAATAGAASPESCFDSVGAPIARLLADHDDAGELLAKIRDLSSGFEAPAGACPSYKGLYHGLQEFERDLHHHVHLENNILFPRALEMERARPSCGSVSQ